MYGWPANKWSARSCPAAKDIVACDGNDAKNPKASRLNSNHWNCRTVAGKRGFETGMLLEGFIDVLWKSKPGAI
jgi:hypothetical protein